MTGITKEQIAADVVKRLREILAVSTGMPVNSASAKIGWILDIHCCDLDLGNGSSVTVTLYDRPSKKDIEEGSV